MKISVVIPCRNEAPYIEECIKAIYACDLPANTELSVFVVDGMSDDGTREKIKTLIESQDFPLLNLVDNTKQLTPYAFNLGIHADPDADFIQIVGARHILSKNYLQNSLNHLENNAEIWCVGGKIINEYVNEKGKFIAKAMSTVFGMGLGNFRTLSKSGFTDTVTSPMYPRWVFEKVGYFDEELVRNQDDDFNFRITQAGGKIYYDNDISLKYYVRGNYRNLYKQFFQYGYWKVYVNKKHKAVTTFRQLIPPLFVMFLFAFPFSFLIHLKLGMAFNAILGFYILLNMVFSFKLATNFKAYIHTLYIFPLLHLSYGLGYLKGLLTFVFLGKKPSERAKSLSR